LPSPSHYPFFCTLPSSIPFVDLFVLVVFQNGDLYSSFTWNLSIVPQPYISLALSAAVIRKSGGCLQGSVGPGGDRRSGTREEYGSSLLFALLCALVGCKHRTLVLQECVFGVLANTAKGFRFSLRFHRVERNG